MQAVFDEDRSERQAQRKELFEERLTQMVSDGKITEDQKKLILAKHEEMQSQREAQRDEFQNMTPEERRSAVEEHHEELESWAEDNEIDIGYLFGFGRHKGMHGQQMM